MSGGPAVPARMRGLRKRSRAAGDVRVEEVDVPEPAAGEVLLRVAACGLCGSDVHAARSDPGFEWVNPPVILGHELAGTVVAVGAGAGVVVGDRVVAVSTQGCGRCELCAQGLPQVCRQRRIVGLHYDGGVADYVRLTARHLVPVPSGLDPVHAALAEPLSVAVHAVLELSAVHPGSRVVVSGPGPIGLLCASLARAAGGDVLVLGAAPDRARRLPLAERLGLATASGDAQAALSAHFGSRLPDLWFEASGAVPAFDAGVRSLQPGGQLTVIAQYAEPVSFFIPDLLRRQLRLQFSYAANPAGYRAALDLLADGTVDAELLVDRYPLEAAEQALADAGDGTAVKAMVVPGS